MQLRNAVLVDGVRSPFARGGAKPLLVSIVGLAILPTLLAVRVGVPFYFGGTALLIVVGVGLDTIGQIEAHLVTRQYEGFVKGTRIRGRLGR